MTFLGFLNNWWNLPFLVMLGLVGVFFLLQVIGIAAHGDSDVDADGGDADADADADHDVDHDADGDGDHDGDGMWSGVMSFFGIGRVPFMVVWVTFFIFAGFAGLTWNRVIAAQGGGYPTWAFVAALALALIVGAFGVRVFSRLAARFVDVGGRGSVKKHELCGKVGVVASATVDDKFGEVRVRDDAGNEMLVHGKLQAGEAPLARGTQIVLVDYDEKSELFWVSSVPELTAKG